MAESFTFTAGAMRIALRAALAATARDDERPALHGVTLLESAGLLGVIGADGYTMCSTTVETLFNAPAGLDVMVNPHAARAVLLLCESAARADECVATFDGDALTVRVGDTEVRVKKSEHSHPDFGKVHERLSGNPVQHITTIPSPAALAAFCHKHIGHTFSIALAPATALRATVNDAVWSSGDSAMPVEPIHIAPELLHRILSGLPERPATVFFSGAMAALRIECGDVRAYVMPAKVGGTL